MWDKQVDNAGLPGLYSELEEHFVAMGISDLRGISKWIFKKNAKDYIRKKNCAEILSDIQGYKKLDYDKLASESFERKAYF